LCHDSCKVDIEHSLHKKFVNFLFKIFKYKVTKSNISKIIKAMDAKEITVARKHKLSGASLFSDNKKLALTKAGTTLLNAYDAGAEILVVEDEATYDMIENNFAQIENVMGRKMRGLVVVLATDFIAQSEKLTA